MEEVNSVDIKALRRDLGEKGLREIMQLQRWLECPHKWPLVGKPTDKDLQRLKPRFASSIITRGEAELLGISYPRFSFRLYPKNSRGEARGLINCRRLGTMCSNVKSLSPRKADHSARLSDLTEVAARRSLPTDTIQKGTVVADSLVAFPRTGRNAEYRVLTVNLGRAYGEARDMEGTPYIKNFDLTGLCAQATCFMANAILAQHARGIYGIGEISKLAYLPEDDGAAEMEIFGLGKEHFINYFRHPKVGLNAFWHSVTKPKSGHHPKQRGAAKAFSRIASVYLRSGFPVVVLLDAGRMAGIPSNGLESKVDEITEDESIYKSNGLRKELMREHFEDMRIRSHAALVVGYKDRDGEDEFLINDPARFPFMKASAEQLWRARAYNDEFDGSKHAPVPGKDHFQFRLLPLQFMPCLPGRVRLPLIDDEFSPEQTNDPVGRWTLEKVIRTVLLEASLSGRATGVDFLRLDFDRVRLMPLTEVGTWIQSADNPLRIHQDEAGSLVRLVSGYSAALGDRWCWVNWFRREGTEVPSLWIYDAEKDPAKVGFALNDNRPIEKAGGFLISAICHDRNAKGKWSVCSSLPGQPPLPASRARVDVRQDNGSDATDDRGDTIRDLVGGVSLSLLTSFSVKGIDSALQHWPGPNGRIAAELYCFMQDDASRYLPFGRGKWAVTLPFVAWQWLFGRVRNRIRKTRLPRLNRKAGQWRPYVEFKSLPGIPIRSSSEPAAVDRMARWANREKKIEALASKLVERFGEKSVTIVAMASYFPELSASDEGTRSRGVRALTFLIKLGAALMRQQSRHKEIRAFVPPKMTIEFVGGTVMDGIFLAKRNNRPDYDERRLVTNIRDWGAALDCLNRSLIEVGSLARALNVTLLAEMEPGPGYVLGSLEKMRAFSTMVRSHPALKGVVGVNFDWAHWHFIEGHSVSSIPEALRELMERGHVSDHCNGAHFGDVALGEIHGEWDDYRDFFEFLAGDSNRSGSVSIELECVRDMVQVTNSLSLLRRFGVGKYEN